VQGLPGFRLPFLVHVLNRPFKHFSKIGLQRVGNPQKGIHGRIIVIILQAADRGLIQASRIGQLVFGQLKSLSFDAHEADDFGTNRSTAFSFCHARILHVLALDKGYAYKHTITVERESWSR
jgi:hypothetical protein